jgi:hypothetical protein
MSFLETAPLVNPTTVISKPNQQIFSNVSPPINHYSPIIREQTFFKNPPPTISNIAYMEKPIAEFRWNTSNQKDTILFNIDLDLATLQNLIGFGYEQQSFLNFDTISCVLRRTDMANYQGLALMVFDPAPIRDYYTSVFGIDYAVKNDFQLAMTKMIEPKTAEDIVFNIPFHVPFEMLGISNYVGDPTNAYFRSYSFGTIRISVVTPLETTNAKQQISYRFAMYLNNLQTTGNVFKN